MHNVFYKVKYYILKPLKRKDEIFVFITLFISFFLLLNGMMNDNDLNLYVSLFLTYFSILIYSIINIKKNITLFFFLITFFTFLLGKIFFSFGGNELGLYYYNNRAIINHVFFSLYISLTFCFIGYVFIIPKNKSKLDFADNQKNILGRTIIRMITFIILILCFISVAFTYIEKIIFVNQFGYLSLYTDFQTSLHPFVLRLHDIFPFIFFLYLATFPPKRAYCTFLILFALLGVLSLGFGQRNIFIQNIIITLIYPMIRMYIDQVYLKLNKKVVIGVLISLPLCFLLLVNISNIRDGEEIDFSNSITEFFNTQGNSVNVIGTGIRFKYDLKQTNYSFYEINYFLKHNFITNMFKEYPDYSQNTKEMALYGGSYGQAISYYYNPKSFLEGRGIGSCYIAEVYQDFGYIGIIITNLFYGFVLAGIYRLNKKNTWLICIFLYMIKNILYAPRSAPFVFLDIISFTNLFIILFLLFLIFYYKKKNWKSENKLGKKVLFISDFYEPDNTIAAVRVVKLAKYLSLKGLDVSVITNAVGSQAYDDSRKEHIIRIKQVNILSFLKQKFSKRNDVKVNSTITISQEKENKRKRIIKSRLIEFLYLMNSLIKNFCFYLSSIIFITRNKLYDYDYVFSTYGQFTPHLIAKHIKAVNPKIMWIADFRDPVFTQINFSIFKPYCSWYIENIMEFSDSVCAVSSGVLDTINSNGDNFVLTNGYDLDDKNNLIRKSQSKLVISYTGTLYKGKSNLKPFFGCLSKLYKMGKIDLDLIELHYAGLMPEEFIRQISYYDLNVNIINHGSIRKQESLELQMNSHLLLLSAWNNIGNTGIITGKIYEYIMMNKPIIACISGNLENSEMKNIIEQGNLGFCYEEKSDNISGLEAFILLKYQEYIKTNDISAKYNYKFIEKFNYSEIANHLLCEFEKGSYYE